MNNRRVQVVGLAGIVGVGAVAAWLLVRPATEPVPEPPEQQPPIKTQNPELTTLAEQVQIEAEAAPAAYTPKLAGNFADLSRPAGHRTRLPGEAAASSFLLKFNTSSCRASRDGAPKSVHRFA
jgi:hypothetical protein